MGITTTSTITDRLQSHFSKKLVQHAVNKLRLNEFGMQADLPQRASSKKIAFYRKRKADADQVQNLDANEGVPPTTYTEVALDKVEVELQQFGELTKVSDVARLIDLFPILDLHISTMGEDAALKADSLTRDAIVANPATSTDLPNSQVTLYNSNTAQERFAGQVNTLNSSVDFNSLRDDTDANETKLNRARALACATQLKVNNAPTINGCYTAVIAPEVCHDLVQDTDWLEAAKYSNVDALYNGEIGKLDGVRYCEATNPFVEDDVYGAYDNTDSGAAGLIYTTLFFGKDAYGVPKLGGTTSPWSPKCIILDKPDKSDPLNQFCLAGWKVFWAPVLLNKEYVVSMRSKSTFA